MIRKEDFRRFEIASDKSLSYEEKCKLIEKENLNNHFEFGFEFGAEKGCPICNYRGGYLVFKENEHGDEFNGKKYYESWHECECVERHRKEEERKKARIPERFKNIRMKDIDCGIYINDKDKEICKKVKEGFLKTLNDIDNCNKEGYGIGIWGIQKGSGKTMIMCAFANELLDKGYRVRFVNQIDLIDRIKASWDNSGKKGEEKEKDIIEDLKKCDVLIIDELGFNGSGKEWLNNEIYLLINNRYENKKPIYYTSNIDLSNMNFDDRIVSRLKEMCEDIEYTEEDLRPRSVELGRRKNF